MTTPDPTRSKAIEVTARAICGPPGNACEACRLSAERALTAYESHLQAEGMAVVPVDLSDEQVRDLRFQSAPYPKHPDADQVWSMGPRHVRAFWQKAIAMLSASPYGKAFQPMGSAEAQSAVANSPSIKAGKEESNG